MTLGDIINKYRTEHKMSMDKFSNVSGLSKGYISMLEKNKHPRTGNPITPSLETFISVANAINIDLNELISQLDDEQSIEIKGTKNNIDYKKYGLQPVTTKKLPLLGEIACGEPTYADEDRESYVEVGTDIKADVCLKAKGDSMINARIHDGDIVFIREQPVVENGEIAAVIIGNEATLKRVEYLKDKNILMLKPENAKYETLIYTNEELDQIKILGKAIAFQSDIH